MRHDFQARLILVAFATSLALSGCGGGGGSAEGAATPATNESNQNIESEDNLATASTRLILWTQPGTRVGMDGTQAKPFGTVQAALERAKLSAVDVEIRVRTGTYKENLVLPKLTVALTLRRDGAGEARIVAKDDALTVIKGLGVKKVTIDGLTVVDGVNGIQFSMSGSDFTRMGADLVVKNNVLLSQKEDGIKVSQADRVKVLNNRVDGAGQEGIDFVAVNDSVIQANDVGHITGKSAAIFVKGGSTRVQITGNYVHSAAVDGIIVGGWTESKFFRPGYDTYEAKNVVATGNYVQGIGKRAVNVLAAVDSKVTNNILKANPAYYYIMAVGPGKDGSGHVSRNVEITGNSLDISESRIQKIAGNTSGLVVSGNRSDGSGSFAFSSVGPR